MDAATALFARHDRHWRTHRYVYPVISRRAGGLSLGVNLNPDQACNFDCRYCQVDRSAPPVVRDVDLAVLGDELARLIDHAASGALFAEPPFDTAPERLRAWRDIAFSGDGEPTAEPLFAEACRLVARLLPAQRARGVRPVVITNATLLDRPQVEAGLAELDPLGVSVWAKLDAGTDAYYHAIERTKVPLAKVLANIAACGARRPVTIQALFCTLDGIAPDEAELDAWRDRLVELRARGARIALVQVYTVVRVPSDAGVGPLDATALERIAARARGAGFSAEVYPGRS